MNPRLEARNARANLTPTPPSEARVPASSGASVEAAPAARKTKGKRR